MKVLVCGGLGSIGSRYAAILKYLDHEPVIFDTKINSEMPEDWERAIIATPSYSHYDVCKKMIDIGKPFLCEKPLSKDVKQCEELVSLDKKQIGFVVNNYKFITRKFPKPRIKYNFYKTGHDGLEWDCSQLIYIDPECQLKTISPIWSFTIGLDSIFYSELENSYLKMIRSFLEGHTELLWNLQNGLEMTKAVLKRVGK